MEDYFQQPTGDDLTQRIEVLEQVIAGMNPRNLAGLSESTIRDLAAINIFGDGSDGDVAITSGTTTLTRDMFYDDLTISSGATLKPSGYRVFVRGTLNNAGTITVPGGNGSAGGLGIGGGGAGAAAHTGKSCPDTVAGSTGGNGDIPFTSGTAGTNGVNSTRGIGTAGVGGGGGGSSYVRPGYGGGAGGSISGTALNVPRSPWSAYQLVDYPTPTTVQTLGGSASGGGGGGGGSYSTSSGNGGAGGGSGSPGGFVVIFANKIINTGSILSPGGNGGAGGDGADANTVGGSGGGGGGGGAGGNGGVILLCYGVMENTGTIAATGGTGGAGGSGGTKWPTGGPSADGGDGGVGTDGAAGTIIQIDIG